MPLLGLAPTPAILNVGRLGAMRLAFTGADVEIDIGGVDYTDVIRLGSLVIRDILNDIPNTCDFVVGDVADIPVVGQSIVITRGRTLLFGGAIERVTQAYAARVTNLAWQVSCQDHTRLLRRRRVSARYTNTSASVIALLLVSGTGINGALASSGGFVPDGLDAIDVIEFNDQEPADCLTTLAQMIGGYWYVDYERNLHFFLEEVDTPLDVVPTASWLMHDPPVSYDVDSSQLRTRVLVTGAGSNTLVPVRVGTSIMPMDDTSPFGDAGGLKSGLQVLAHTGNNPGGAATNVVSATASPSSAPSVGLSTSVVGSILGIVSYKLTYANSGGETAPSAASSNVTGTAFAVPSGGPSVATTGSLGRLVGDYRYKYSFVNDRGETTLSAASSLISPAGISAPGQPSAAEVSSTIGALIGTFNYKITFVTQYGETLLGTARSITTTAQSAPSAPSAAVTANIGPLFAGAISYKVSFVSALGETLGTTTGNFSPSPFVASAPTVGGSGTGLEIAYAVTYVHPVYGESALSSRTVDTDKGTNPVVTVNSLPTGCGWNVYSTGTVTAGTGGTAALFKVAEMGVGTSSFTHTTQTGPAEGVRATLGTTVSVTSIPTGPTGTVARRIYRPRAGGSTYYLVGELGDNSTTSFTDNVPDTALTVTAPSTNPNGKQVSVTSIPTGATGTLARRVYRTKAGGSEYFRIGELQDNTATSLTDNTPDSALTQDAPLVNTAGGQQITVSTISAGPTGTLARRIYRTKNAGSEYFYLGQISDNSGSSTFTDNLLDDALGDLAPLTNTAGASAVNVSFSTPPAGLFPRLYRTEGGGSVYRFITEIRDGSTSYVDTKADTELGDVAPTVSTIGVLFGATALTVADASRLPSAGWARVESQLISWTGKSGATLTGIPVTGTPGGTPLVNGSRSIGATSIVMDGLAAGGTYKAGDSLKFEGHSTYYDVSSDATADGSGNITVTLTSGLERAVANNAAVSMTNLRGAIKSDIPDGSTVIVVPMLTGVSGITRALAQGDLVSVYETRNDTAAQAALAAAEGSGDGVIEYSISGNWTRLEARARGDAELELFSLPLTRLRCTLRNLNTRSGRTLSVNLPSLGIVDAFTIQSVTIDQIGTSRTHLPRYTVEASTTRISLEDALRRLLAA